MVGGPSIPLLSCHGKRLTLTTAASATQSKRGTLYKCAQDRGSGGKLYGKYEAGKKEVRNLPTHER